MLLFCQCKPIAFFCRFSRRRRRRCLSYPILVLLELNLEMVGQDLKNSFT